MLCALQVNAGESINLKLTVFDLLILTQFWADGFGAIPFKLNIFFAFGLGMSFCNQINAHQMNIFEIFFFQSIVYLVHISNEFPSNFSIPQCPESIEFNDSMEKSLEKSCLKGGIYTLYIMCRKLKAGEILLLTVRSSSRVIG